MSNVRALTIVQRARWRNAGVASKPAFNTSQMQASHLQPSPQQGSLLWPGSERRFALLVLSVNGMRFAQLNSQKVAVLRRRRPALRASTVGNGRLARFHFNPVRHRLRSALFPLAASVPFGHKRPNPSIEGMPKRLRLLCTPHVKR